MKWLHTSSVRGLRHVNRRNRTATWRRDGAAAFILAPQLFGRQILSYSYSFHIRQNPRAGATQRAYHVARLTRERERERERERKRER